MKVIIPGDVSGVVGAAQEVLRARRERVATFLSGGTPSGGVTRELCPVCGTRIDARPIDSSGVTWSRLVTHLTTAHDAWWPQLDELDDFLFREPDSSAVDDGGGIEPGNARSAPSLSDLSDYSWMDRETEQDAPSIFSGTPQVTVDRRKPRSAGVRPGRPTVMQPQGSGMREAEAASTISTTYAIAPELANEIVRVAKEVGAHPYDLANLISLESNGTFSPKVAGPRSTGATGLIQITESTARWLGTTTTELAKLNALEQMPWVQTYLDKVRNGRALDTAHKMAMSVFYPKAIDWSPSQQFPAEVTKRNTHRLPDGTIFPIKTPADYLKLMRGRSKLPAGQEAGPITPDAEGGLDTILNWMSAFFSPGVEEASPTGASWDLSPGVSAILKDQGGREWSAGPVPAGTYRLVLSGSPPSPPVRLEAGMRYRASSIGQLFQVG